MIPEKSEELLTLDDGRSQDLDAVQRRCGALEEMLGRAVDSTDAALAEVARQKERADRLATALRDCYQSLEYWKQVCQKAAGERDAALKKSRDIEEGDAPHPR